MSRGGLVGRRIPGERRRGPLSFLLFAGLLGRLLVGVKETGPLSLGVAGRGHSGRCSVWTCPHRVARAPSGRVGLGTPRVRGACPPSPAPLLPLRGGWAGGQGVGGVGPRGWEAATEPGKVPAEGGRGLQGGGPENPGAVQLGTPGTAEAPQGESPGQLPARLPAAGLPAGWGRGAAHNLSSWRGCVRKSRRAFFPPLLCSTGRWTRPPPGRDSLLGSTRSVGPALSRRQVPAAREPAVESFHA